MSILDNLCNIKALDREYYGNSEIKPCKPCYWSDTPRPGWYESDDSFKVRYKAQIKKDNM